MREINLKEDLEKIYPLIKQLRNNLSLEDFLEKFQLAKKLNIINFLHMKMREATKQLVESCPLMCFIIIIVFIFVILL